MGTISSMHSNLLHLLLLGCISNLSAHEGHHEAAKIELQNAMFDTPVLLISMDGFRYDYLKKIEDGLKVGETNYFRKLIDHGVWAPEGIRNAFSTVTFPNHYSIATGLYEENHGIVGSVIYDPASNHTYNLPGDNSKAAAALYGGEPIWQTYASQRGDSTVGCYMWVGCSVPIGGKPLIPDQVPYNISSFQDRVDYAVKWLTGGMKLVLLYFNEPDHTGHGFGPDSDEVLEVLLDLNTALGSLLNELEERGMGPDKLNVILTSDHGMVSFNDQVVMPLRDDLFQVRTFHYAVWMVEPHEGKENATIEYFRSFKPHVNVYRKSEVPERWHFSKSPHVSPIVVVAVLGAELLSEKPPKEQTWKATAGHGYDNRYHEMSPVFMARGPAFKPRFKLTREDKFHNVDIYLLVSKLLGLQPAANNGTESLVESLLKPRFVECIRKLESFREGRTASTAMNLLIIAACVLGVFGFTVTYYVLYRRRARASANRFNSVQSVSRLGNGVTYRPLSREEAPGDKKSFTNQGKPNGSNGFPIPIPSGSDSDDDF